MRCSIQFLLSFNALRIPRLGPQSVLNRQRMIETPEKLLAAIRVTGACGTSARGKSDAADPVDVSHISTDSLSFGLELLYSTKQWISVHHVASQVQKQISIESYKLLRCSQIEARERRAIRTNERPKWYGYVFHNRRQMQRMQWIIKSIVPILHSIFKRSKPPPKGYFKFTIS